MSFDPEHLPPRSASAHIPSFPQGQRGRSAGWTTGSSIPIRIVSSGLGGIYRAGKELGRGVDMARRRTGGAAANDATDGRADLKSANAASVSFEGDTEVDLLGGDASDDRSEGDRYDRSHAAARRIDHGSARSDLSLLSTLANEAPTRGSQPSSAETPSTRFSETEDPSADADDCDWDTLDASRSPAAPIAPHFDVMDTDTGSSSKREELPGIPEDLGINSADDEFTLGLFEEDSGDATVLQSRTSLSPPQDLSNKIGAARRELVYALPSGGSTRSSLLSQSSGLTTMADNRSEGKASQPSPRDSSPSNSDGGDSGSAGSGMLCEGSKVTQTPDSLSASAAEPVASDKDGLLSSIDAVSAAKPISISTSGGGAKKKKKKGGR
uniref:Uncharacterized protein n=2 Tax=Kalmanozyma brasiliensis (strain GHG001) TaxID=1365824 RepID=V5EJW5_KALBG